MILTPEEQETIQTPKGSVSYFDSEPLTRLKKQQNIYVNDLDMAFQVQLLKESPAVLSLGKLCEENGYSYLWHPGQAIISR